MANELTKSEEKFKNKLIQKSKEELAEQIIELKNKEFANLGDGKIFIKRTPEGELRAVQGKIGLSEAKGELVDIKGKVMISAAGYYKLNEITNISIETPKNLMLPDGQIVVNPYPIIDRESSSITKVWVKKMGIGYSPIGNLVITSSTLLYDIKMYFVQDLVKKIKSNKSAGKICLESQLTEKDKKTGFFYRIEGDLVVWADYQNPDVLKALSTFINNKLFAERKAQTICERNVLKKHPALAKVQVDTVGPAKQRTTIVPVIGYINELTKEDLTKIAEEAEMPDSDEIEINGQKGKIVNVGGEITEEDVMAAEEEPEEKEPEEKGDGLF